MLKSGRKTKTHTLKNIHTNIYIFRHITLLITKSGPVVHEFLWDTDLTEVDQDTRVCMTGPDDHCFMEAVGPRAGIGTVVLDHQLGSPPETILVRICLLCLHGAHLCSNMQGTTKKLFGYERILFV